jgi:hypothetical protein
MTNPNPWPQFTDLVKGQSAAWLTGPKDRLNEFQKHSYVLGHMLPGSEPHQFLSSGDALSSKITLKEMRGYGPFDASELITYRQTQTGAVATSHWTTARDTLGWNEREILTQNGGWSDEDRSQTMFNVYEEKLGNFWRSLGNTLDDEYFAKPVTAMESATGNIPRSLFSLINECNIRGGDNTWAAGTGTAPVANGYWPGFTTLAGIDPTDYPGSAAVTGSTLWGCTQKTYTQLHNASTEGFRVLSAADLTFQIDAMLLDLNWAKVPRAEQYSVGNGKKIILTTRQGIQAIRQSLISTSNDRWQGMDAAQMSNEISYGGHTVLRMTGMETAFVYPNYGGNAESSDVGVDATSYTEGGYNSSGTLMTAGTEGWMGPRFMFVDTGDIKSVFHRQKFFYVDGPRQLFESRPDTFGMYVENYRAVHPKRLRSSGFLSPTANIAGVSYTS